MLGSFVVDLVTDVVLHVWISLLVRKGGKLVLGSFVVDFVTDVV